MRLCSIPVSAMMLKSFIIAFLSVSRPGDNKEDTFSIVEQGNSSQSSGSKGARSLSHLFCVNIDIYIVNLQLHRPNRIKRIFYQKECQFEAFCAHSIRKTNQNLPFDACCGGRLTIVVCARSTSIEYSVPTFQSILRT
jgi:hypothetical protein